MNKEKLREQLLGLGFSESESDAIIAGKMVARSEKEKRGKKTVDVD